MLDFLGWSLVILNFLLAYIGLIVPLLPSMPFLLVGFLAYSLFIGKVSLGISFWILSIVIVLLTFVVDWVMSSWTVHKRGGSGYAVWASVGGLILSSMFAIYNPLALLVGPFLAVMMVERWLGDQDWAGAAKVAAGTITGFLAGILVKFFVMTALILWFFLKVAWG
ncbi:DUF456 domain-containing protein [Pasteuria penetrans]|uniref:DUF456 domain-containing protein n=1 Tax=Pasteuria penetrans TaxID=86005 RepID=UPI000F9372DE|nr:DUF456 domain-containing protein [Pasteuria penetrans]